MNIKKPKKSNKYKKVSIEDNQRTNKSNKIIQLSLLLTAIIIIIIFFLFIIFYKPNKTFHETTNKIQENYSFSNKNMTTDLNIDYDVNFKYEEYETEFVTSEIKQKSRWYLKNEKEAYFINGIIRKYKPKRCLEIGVARGGSSVVILNALKDIDNSFLVSLDLNEQLFSDPTKKTGFIVKEVFPELSKNWQLFTGDQPHKFLMKLNITFDFLFLDTAHYAPGEMINIIEALPFLKEKAIIVVHDLLWHFFDAPKTKLYPSNVYLIPAIFGEKVIYEENDSLANIVAIFLYPNQEKHYLDYFLLLLSFWEYMPTENQINDLIEFIKIYYKKDIYLKIFKKAVELNKKLVGNITTVHY
jgi:predicted O-methyltransferase YrrM